MSVINIKDPLHFRMEKHGSVSCVDIETEPIMRLPKNHAVWLMNAYPWDPPRLAAFYFAVHVPTDYDDEKYADFLLDINKAWEKHFGA